MARGRGAGLPREDVLKIDKDCHVSSELEREYVRQSIATLRKHRLRVEWIRATRTNHGRHYYIKVLPAVDASTANKLQYLLGDDANRVDFNQARIDSGLPEWNKLFEAVGRRMRTLYVDKRVEAFRRYFKLLSRYMRRKSRSLADLAEYIDPENGCPYQFQCQDCLGDVCWKD